MIVGVETQTSAVIYPSTRGVYKTSALLDVIRAVLFERWAEEFNRRTFNALRVPSEFFVK
jgi:hypothetical protein